MDGDIAIVQQALKNKKRTFKLKNANRRSILHQACLGGHLEIVKMIFARLPDMSLHEIDRGGNSPIDLAIQSRNLDLVGFLLEKGAHFNDDDTCIRLSNTPGLFEVLESHNALTRDCYIYCAGQNDIERIQRYTSLIVGDPSLFLSMVRYTTTRETMMALLAIPHDKYMLRQHFECLVGSSNRLDRATDAVCAVIEHFQPGFIFSTEEERLLIYHRQRRLILYAMENKIPLQTYVVSGLIEQFVLTKEEFAILMGHRRIHVFPNPLLCSAIGGKQQNNVKLLLGSGEADVNRPNIRMETPLQLAYNSHQYIIAKMLIIHGARVDYYHESYQEVYRTYQAIVHCYLVAIQRCRERGLARHIVSFIV